MALKMKVSSKSKSALANTKAPKAKLGGSASSPLLSKKTYKKGGTDLQDFGSANYGQTGRMELFK